MLTLRQCCHCSRQLTHLLLPVLAVLHLQLFLQRVALRLQLPLLLRLLPPLLLPLLPLQPLLLLDLSLDGRLRKEETGTDIIPSFVVSGHFSHLLPPPVGGSFFISPQPPTTHKVWGRWRDNNITYGAPSCKSPGCLQRQPMTLSHLFCTLPVCTSYPVSLQHSMLIEQDKQNTWWQKINKILGDTLLPTVVTHSPGTMKNKRYPKVSMNSLDQ